MYSCIENMTKTLIVKQFISCSLNINYIYKSKNRVNNINKISRNID